MAIVAQYKSASKFTVQGDHLVDLKPSRIVLLRQGVNGESFAVIVGATFDSPNNVTVCEVSPASVLSTISGIKLGLTYSNSDIAESNLSQHNHIDVYTGGRIPAATIPQNKVVLINDLPQITENEENKVIKISFADGWTYDFVKHSEIEEIGVNTHSQIDSHIVAANQHIAAANPHSGHELKSNKNIAGGYVGLNESVKIDDQYLLFGVADDIEDQTFGDTSSAGSTGKVCDAGHKHAMPANPVTNHESTYNHGNYDSHLNAAGPHSGHATKTDGKVPTSELGTGSASASTILYGDQAWKELTIPGGTTVDGALLMKEIAKPTQNPSSGYQKLYIKDSDHKLYRLDSSGTETLIA